MATSEQIAMAMLPHDIMPYGHMGMDLSMDFDEEDPNPEIEGSGALPCLMHLQLLIADVLVDCRLHFPAVILLR